MHLKNEGKRTLMLTKKILFLTLTLMVISCSQDNMTIGIQAYTDFNTSYSDTIKAALIRSFGYRVVVLPEKELPGYAYIKMKSPRYRADSLLADLRKNKPDSIDYILGLTNRDISTTKKNKNGTVKQPQWKYEDWGVFGLGYQPGPSCVVSTYRLKSNDSALLINRLKKVCIHEMGHNFGLKHCTTKNCVMQDAAETIRTIDSVDLELCPKCRAKL